MNDDIDISNILNQFSGASSSDSPNESNPSEEILNLLLAIKPFITASKKDKLDTYLNIMNFKSFINIFGGD